jgi:hypothetical protein
MVAAASAAYGRDRASLEPILRHLQRHPGRVYAGRKGNWGESYTVGGIPVYHLLSAEALPLIAHVPFSWAWSTDFQLQFDWPERHTAEMYDIRYVLTAAAPPAWADWEVAVASGPHRLYRLRTAGPFSLVSVPLAIAGSFERTWYITQSWAKGLWPMRRAHARLLLEAEVDDARPTVRMLDAFRFSSPGAEATPRHVFVPPGTFVSEPAPPARGTLRDVAEGRGTASVTADLAEPGIVLFKSTYHPAWTAKIDGVPSATMRLTPGLLGVALPAGTHRLDLVYGRPWLAALLGLGGCLAAWRLDRRRRTVRLVDPQAMPVRG